MEARRGHREIALRSKEEVNEFGSAGSLDPAEPVPVLPRTVRDGDDQAFPLLALVGPVDDSNGEVQDLAATQSIVVLGPT